MAFDLVPHPAAPGTVIRSISVACERVGAHALDMHWELKGDIDAIVLPAAGPPARADGLWRSTCVEAFLKAASGDAYVEINFAPSRRWAAYAFDGYRATMRPLALPDPEIALSRSPESLVVDIRIAIDVLPRADWQGGLSAVVEERSGTTGYWALAHAGPVPDFHAASCFTAALRAATRP